MISGNTQCYHHVPLIILVVIAGTDKERPGCSKIHSRKTRKMLVVGGGEGRGESLTFYRGLLVWRQTSPNTKLDSLLY